MNYKFRAWDKELEKMQMVTLMDWNQWWVGTGMNMGERNSFNNEETDRHILMQFTGLHDCNGKEIYEGDIVKRLNWEYAYIVKHDDERTGFYYHDHSNLDDDHMSMIMSRENVCEVIGNIYENPELLEETK